MSVVRAAIALGIALGACGGTKPGDKASTAAAAPDTIAPAPAPASSSAPLAASSSSPPPPPAADPKRPGPTEIFTKLRDELIACYEEGKKALPTMTSGRVTFHVEVDEAGRSACVVPSDDTGLTQEVEACMGARLARETYPSSGTSWSSAIPLVVRDGAIALGAVRTTPSAIETIESHGLAEDVYDVVGELLPGLYDCVRGIDKSAGLRVLYIGGRVGRDGRVECALASSAVPITPEVRQCTSRVLMGAKFRAPKKGYGLVSIPLNVFSRR